MRRPVFQTTRFSLVLGLVLAGFAAPANRVEATDDDNSKPIEQLIVFLGKTSGSPGSRGPESKDEESRDQEGQLSNDELKQLRSLSRTEGLQFEVRRIADGAPSEVKITPLIVFQNHRGRSIYQGRYNHLDRVLNFVRTSRWFPQEGKPLERESVLLRHDGRTTTAVKTKVTPIQGQVSSTTGSDSDTEEKRRHEVEEFQLEVGLALANSLRTFRPASRVQLSAGDRTFYFDFYPYRSGGQLFVSTAIFSQFDCHEPIYTRFDNPVSGPWEERAAVFQSAAQQLEETLDSLLTDSTSGDDFAAVPSDTPARSWKELRLPLPPAPAEARGPSVASNTPLVGQWKLAPRGKGDPPQLQFQFPSPLDSYSGELRDITGELRFSPIEGGTTPEARSLEGRIVVQVDSVTMGDESLDDSLLGSDTLDAKRFPTSSFVVERAETDPGPLRFGELRTVVLSGVFTMKGTKIPLTTQLSLEPIATDQGEARLRAVGTFQIRLLHPFGIEGPDGPGPANDTLVFRYDLRFKPNVVGG